jgi:hypothetical protein
MLIWQVEKYTMLQHTLILFEILINYFFCILEKTEQFFSHRINPILAQKHLLLIFLDS